MSVRNTFEALETRSLFSATLTAGILRAVGDPTADNTITVRLNAAKTKVVVSVNGSVSQFNLAGIKRLIVHGGSGNDNILVNENVIKRQTIFGYAGNDVETGLGAAKGRGWIKFWGMDGNDTLTSLGGRAFMDAGDGNDSVVGSKDDDLIAGGVGNDTLKGMDGDDSLFGGDGLDVLSGGNGNDYLDGGAGANQMLGDGGNDLLVNAGGAVDLMFGGAGNDTMNGGVGLDTLVGGDGDDLIHAGSMLNSVTAGTTTLLSQQMVSIEASIA